MERPFNWRWAAFVVMLVGLAMGARHACADTMDTCIETNGVAPYLVQCDVTRQWTTLPECSTWSDTHLAWDFGDNDAATYVTGAKKNQATGFQGSHVYESPGTYTVTLTVTHSTDGDLLPMVTTHTQTVTVADPETTYANATLYVAAAGDDGNPGTMADPIKTWHEARTRLFASNGPRRVLLKRGETFSATSSFTIGSTTTGPFCIGAYGDGADPVINSTNGSPLLITSANEVELTYMDLKLTGSGAIGFRPGKRTLALRCTLDGLDSGVSTSSSYGSRDQNGLVECQILNSVKYGVYYNMGEWVSILGCTIDGVTTSSPGEHLTRCYLTHSSIVGNKFRNGRSNKHQLKFDGFFPTGDANRPAGTPTETVEFCVISDNVFESPVMPWPVAVAPTDDAKDMRITNLLIERNRWSAGSGTQVMLYGQSATTTVRNNIFDMSGASGTCTAIRLSDTGIVPPPDDWFVAGNTAYRPSTSNAARFLLIDAACGDTIAKNNLLQADSATLFVGTGASLTVTANLATGDADFVDQGAGDFHLQSTSAACGAGVVIPELHEDFDRAIRPRGAVPPVTADIGAFKR